jgi:hypothetical protein
MARQVSHKPPPVWPKKEFPQHFWLLQNDQEIKKVRKK